MSLKQDIQSLLKKHGITPDKLRGQHFLVHAPTLQKIAALATPEPGESIVEIGPGIGNLTRELLGLGAPVIAIEKDETMVNVLRAELKNKNLTIHTQDVLDFDETAILQPYRLVGNIPYYITGPITQKFLMSNNPPQRMVLTVQKEVAERMTAEPPRATFVSVMTEVLGEAQMHGTISRNRFWPQPNVDSAILSITPHRDTVGEQERDLIAFVKIGFRQPRKTLLNNLSKKYNKEDVKKALKQSGLSESSRSHEITLAVWRKLFKELETGKTKSSSSV